MQKFFCLNVENQYIFHNKDLNNYYEPEEMLSYMQRCIFLPSI